MLVGDLNDPLIASLRSREHSPDLWSFKKTIPRKGAHALLHYPAMMVPTLQGLIMTCIKETQPNASSVIDPFVGSGTVLVEAMEHGLDFLGVDINPLAGLACLAKSGPYYIDAFEAKSKSLLNAIETDKKQYVPRNFPGRDKWFRYNDSQTLEKIHHHIRQEPSKWARRLFWLAMCRVIRGICKSRKSTYKLHVESINLIKPTQDPSSEFEDTIVRFQNNLREQHSSLTAKKLLNKGRYTGSLSMVIADTYSYLRKNGNESLYDLVMTSPPYGDNVTTIPYGQFSYLSMQWVDLDDINPEIDKRLIANTHSTDSVSLGGTLRGASIKTEYLGDTYKTAAQFLNLIKEKENGKKRFGAFFYDLDRAVEEIAKLTKVNGIHAWTIANRRICGYEVPMVPLLNEMLRCRGMEVIGNISRDIHFKKMASKNALSATMNKETILLARKF